MSIAFFSAAIFGFGLWSMRCETNIATFWLRTEFPQSLLVLRSKEPRAIELWVREQFGDPIVSSGNELGK